MNNTILIVDDSKHVQRQIEIFLKSEGYSQLLFANSAYEAFNLLNLENDTIDLILMDISMPGIDGVEACQKINTSGHLKNIPVIMITADDTNEGLKKAFDAGAIDYIKKPLNSVELIARINSVLRLKKEMDERAQRETELLQLTQILEETNAKLQQANEMLRHLSRTDSLTGVANRRFFDEILHSEWKRSTRLSKPISLLMIDIDCFKNYNDAYGHQKGDECLKQVANALLNAVKRQCDIISRYGGEEFAALLSDTDEKGALMVANTMQSNLAAMKIPHKNSHAGNNVTVSIGVSSIVPDTTSVPEMLISTADKALYLAKYEGRDRIKFFPTMKT
ncbi:MAG: diguanylate cyclase [Candidatus Kuenenia sp.]|nr:diguanylate cyclase [Candidatus Kuenenia hertensis]